MFHIARYKRLTINPSPTNPRKIPEKSGQAGAGCYKRGGAQLKT